MLSKSQIKRVKSLQQKKYRNKLGLFIVEGKKSVDEFLNSDFILAGLFYTDDYLVNKALIDSFSLENSADFQKITPNELQKISALKNANQVLAIFKIPTTYIISNKGLTIVLDNIKDPGNLGTIIRLCDWFGINQLICSLDTVDCYNPKVVQASMGSLTRVEVIYTELLPYLKRTKLPIYATLLKGENIYKSNLPSKAIILMGNEANGISNEIIKLTTNKINIPHFGKLNQTESLNVATATAIVLSEFKRSE